MPISCDALREWIGSALPEAEWPAEARGHLGSCATCRERLERELETSELLKRISVPAADAAQSDRVRTIMSGSSAAAPKGLLRRLRPLQAVAAALFVILTGTVLLGVFFSDRGQSSAEAAILDSAVAEYKGAIAKAIMLEGRPGHCCEDPDELTAKVSAELDFKPALDSLQKAGFHPVWGGCCTMQGAGKGGAGHVLYQRGKCSVSCFMMKDTGQVFSDSSRARIAGVDCHVFERGGCCLVVSHLNGEVCVLCSRLPRAAMIACVEQQWGPPGPQNYPAGLFSATLKVDGIRCRWCGGNLRILLEGTPGLHAVQVDAESHNVSFRYEPSRVSLESVRTLLKESGYPAQPDSGTSGEPEKH